MRPILLAVAFAALFAACGISQSTTAPLVPAPTPGPSEQPTQVIVVADSNGGQPMPLRVFDRSFAVGSIRSATAAELADVEALDANAVGVYGDDTREILVTWAARDCAEAGSLFVGPGVDEIVIVPLAAADCEPTRNVRGVVVEFKLAVDMKAIRFDLLPSTA